MIKFILATMAAAVVTMAGGNIAPVVAINEPQVEVNKDFYVGAAITGVQTYCKGESSWFTDNDVAENGYGIQGQVGYIVYNTDKLSVALEGRAGVTLNSYFPAAENADLLTYSALIKPQYNFKNIGAYALLGYGASDLESASVVRRETDIVYGAGINYAATETVSLFIDYIVNPAFSEDGFEDIENDVIALGVTYTF
jgi:hypothetical protein